MTNIVLERAESGELLSCSAKGHSGYAKSGSDIICSAITILLRTTLQVLSESKLDLSVKSSKEGELEFNVTNKGNLLDEQKSLLKYSGIFLEKGFNSLCKEFPEYVRFNII